MSKFDTVTLHTVRGQRDDAIEMVERLTAERDSLRRLFQDNLEVYEQTRRAHDADRGLLTAVTRERDSMRLQMEAAERAAARWHKTRADGIDSARADLAAAQQRIVSLTEERDSADRQAGHDFERYQTAQQRIAELEAKYGGGALTQAECVQAARNLGVDITCGRCAGIFYTGHAMEPHCPTCATTAGADITSAQQRVVELELEYNMLAATARKFAEMEADIAAAQQRIGELETRQQELLATIVRVTNETPFPDEIKGWEGQRAKLVAEVGTLRARIAELEAANARHRDIERMEAECDDASHRERLEGQVNQIADALGDESEWSNCCDRGKNALELAGAIVKERDTLTATLRAIAPVYRAAEGQRIAVETWGDEGASAVALARALSTARAALTPEQLELIERVGR